MNNIVNLSNDEKALVVEKKATCPFIGAAVAQDQLPVRNDKQNPLASVEDVRELGNRGGGRLGEVLMLFASGNHSRMRDNSGGLNAQVEEGLFSLEFPGSQGSHPGHSGILQGDPKVLDSGRLDMDNFARLVGRAENGLIKRSDVGRFIAENVFRDPNSRVVGADAFAELIRDFAGLVKDLLLTAVGLSTLRELQQKFTKLTGKDNLIGSAGEFGLLFAFFANKPGAEEVDGEPTLTVDDLELMFVQKRLPAGWETWKKSRRDWGTNTTALMHTARAEYNRLQGLNA
jgi:hypothetical protein